MRPDPGSKKFCEDCGNPVATGPVCMTCRNARRLRDLSGAIRCPRCNQLLSEREILSLHGRLMVSRRKDRQATSKSMDKEKE
jgi:hypothetical protein